MFPATFVALISTFEKSCPCPALAATPANAPPTTSIKPNSCLRMRMPPRFLRHIKRRNSITRRLVGISWLCRSFVLFGQRGLKMRIPEFPTSLSLTLAIALISLSIAFSPVTAGAAQQHQDPAPPLSDHTQHNHGGFMQNGMHHAAAKGIKLEQQVDTANHTVTLREGPITLPANTSHMMMPQPPDVFWSIPLDAFLLSYTPRLVDADGNAVPGTVLHHTAFWNTDRSDFLCPNKEEHIFGAGSELTNRMEIPGYGYRVQKGDKIRIETMVHNPTGIAYDKVYLEVKIPYADSTAATKGIYPTWMDVQSCGNSGYDLHPGKNETVGTVTVKYNGILLGVGGHMHDYAKQIVLEDATRKETVATLNANVDEKGQLVSMPVVTFFDRGGYKFAAGDQLRITATYDNVTGKPLPAGAMGIVVGYFLPADDSGMSALRRKPKPATRQVAATHE